MTGIFLSVCCMETGTGILVTPVGYAMQISTTIDWHIFIEKN